MTICKISADATGSTLTLLRGPRLLLRQPSSNRLHLLACRRNALPSIRRCVNQLFQISRKLRSIGVSNLTEDWFDLCKHSYVLPVAVIEELQTYCSVVDERRSHIPIGNDHTNIATVLAKQRRTEVSDRFWMKLTEIPVPGFPHSFFAAQFVQSENKSRFLLLRHCRSSPLSL